MDYVIEQLVRRRRRRDAAERAYRGGPSTVTGKAARRAQDKYENLVCQHADMLLDVAIAAQKGPDDG